MATKTDEPKKSEKAKPAALTDADVDQTIGDAVKGLKGKADRAQVVAALRTAADLLNRDDTWLAGADDAA